MSDATVFAHNHERFQRRGLVPEFFERVLTTATAGRYTSGGYFTMDGTLIQSGEIQFVSLKADC